MLKTWVEINRKAVQHNVRVMRKILKPKTQLWAVVKSNAYGHGLTLFSELLSKIGVDGFCVDSLIEGVKLRKNGLLKPVLVLGPSLPNNSLGEAFKYDIALTISNWEALKRLEYFKKETPLFHIKVDTGMHRQGFYLDDIGKVSKFIKAKRLSNSFAGAYTHFASAKDLNYPAFTDFQYHAFKKALKIFDAAGFGKITRHAAATGGALVKSEYHLDAVRIGIGLYGLWPSKELEAQLGTKLTFQPSLSWKGMVSEVKVIPKDGYVGYDLVERVTRETTMAIVPIGYWHGFDRGLSSIGEVLIGGKRARVLGRVSMDLIVVDVTGIKAKTGSQAVLIGKQGQNEITAQEVAQKINTSPYEIVTRINPLIERILV